MLAEFSRLRRRVFDRFAGPKDVGALHAWVEERAQFVEALSQATAEASIHRLREDVEARIQEAGQEARAFADQGLNVHGAALKALGRVIADLRRDNRRLASEREALTARMTKCEFAIERMAASGGERAPAGSPDRSDAGILAEDATEDLTRTPAPQPFWQHSNSKSRADAEASGGPIRLHFDGGMDPLPSYVHVALHTEAQLGAMAEIQARTLRAGEVEEIVATHVVERFSAIHLADQLLPLWRALLAEGGRLILGCRDGEALLGHLRTHDVSFDAFRTALLRDDGEASIRNLVTPGQMKTQLERSGFSEVKITSRAASPSGGFVFTIAARKSAS